MLKFLLIFIPFFNVSAGIFENHATADSIVKKSQNVRIMFYNTENLYDPYDDTTTLDNEFTSAGAKHWTYSRFQKKVNHLAKTILAVGEWHPPAVIGMCEVENKYVLQKLIYNSPLAKFRYRLIHFDSPDSRGVDVAMLYNPGQFIPINAKNIRITFPWDTSIMTRDILYVKGIFFSGDTFHLMVNHWPSRRGGVTQSQPRRNYVAGMVKAFTDSLFLDDPSARIILMGDFNDEPGCESLREVLQAKEKPGASGPGLVNLMSALEGTGMGTHKFQGHWGILDQFIVSEALISEDDSVYTSFKDAHVFSGDFLSEDDERYFGKKPVRTYSGPAYVGGFSDHLPVWLEIHRK